MLMIVFVKKINLNQMSKIDNIQKVLGLLLIALLFSACEDVLDQVPSDKVTVDRILSKSTVSGFWSNCYADMPKTFTGHSGSVPLEAYTDDAFRAGTTSTAFKWHNGLLSPSTPMFGNAVWTSCWAGIRKCNLALENIPKATTSEEVLPEKTKQRWLDEVTALRAWYHFVLIRNFGALPFVDAAYSTGFEDWESITRPTYDEVVMRIVQDCDSVIAHQNIPLRWTNSDDFYRINKAFALALKSRVLLYNASVLNNPTMDQDKWQLAAEAAQACVDSLALDYSLLDMANYEELFSEAVTATSAEIILRSSVNDAATLNGGNGIDLYYYGSTAQSGNCGAVPTQELVDCFELSNGSMPVASYTNEDHTAASFAAGYSENAGDSPYANRDARLAHAILFNEAQYGIMKGMTENDPEITIYTYEGKSGSGFNALPLSQEEADKRSSCTGYYTRKFRSASYWGTSAGGTRSHKIYFRLAEIYLNLAEAQCALGQLDAAIAALNVVRLRAQQPDITLVSGFEKSQDFLMQRIRNERRVELCFEGHRFYDQRRWKSLDTNSTITGMKITSDTGYSSGEFSYQRVKIDVARSSSEDKYLVLPLAREEARKLPGIGQLEVWE